MKLNDPTQAKSVQEVLAQGMKGDFWDVLCQAMKESIDHIRNEQNGAAMRHLPADQYKVENEIMIAKIGNLEHLMQLPKLLISYLNNPNETGGKEKTNFDPYPTYKDFEK